MTWPNTTPALLLKATKGKNVIKFLGNPNCTHSSISIKKRPLKVFLLKLSPTSNCRLNFAPIEMGENGFRTAAAIYSI